MAALSAEELQVFMKVIESVLGASGMDASGTVGDGAASSATPKTSGVTANSTENPNRIQTVQTPVGGPPGNLIAPSYAPSGVIFGGGSPFKVDDGPAILQNRLVALRDIMNSPLGQQLIKGIGFTGSGQ